MFPTLTFLPQSWFTAQTSCRLSFAWSRVLAHVPTARRAPDVVRKPFFHVCKVTPMTTALAPNIGTLYHQVTEKEIEYVGTSLTLSVRFRNTGRVKLPNSNERQAKYSTNHNEHGATRLRHLSQYQPDLVRGLEHRPHIVCTVVEA